ncbi:hypothetical protein ACFQH9_06380 [Pseudonocardia lutea]|uniref:Uncharacterized protein n=1 Tax=Pseudonocardia lutea TaxID=2172015 RepID=A0ABW1I688_9PSEU
MPDERWVMAYEYDGSVWRVTATRRIGVGEEIVAGREGELPLGVHVPDVLVSRRAMTVTATEDGWTIRATNRNGAVLHPWCLPSHLIRKCSTTVDWPLVGVRLLPGSRTSQHWLLLEFDDPSTLVRVGEDEDPPEVGQHRGPVTATAFTPRGLTRAEREALEAVFPRQLQWPPHEHTEPVLLKQAASRLRLSISGLQDRLKSALARALALGLDRPVALTDPAYLHVLARAGYLEPPLTFDHRSSHDPPWFGCPRTQPA